MAAKEKSRIRSEKQSKAAPFHKQRNNTPKLINTEHTDKQKTRQLCNPLRQINEHSSFHCDRYG